LFKPLDGVFLFLSCWWQARKIRKTFPFDLIDAQLAFPDGFAAYLLSRLFKVPFTVTLRGHDVNHLPVFPVRRRQICLALKGASRVMAVAEALRIAAVDLGCPSQNTETIPNGVDRTLFYPTERDAARRLLGLPASAKIILTVGHLVERKGHHLVVQALASMVAERNEDYFLAVVGGPGEEGDLRSLIESEVIRLGLTERVRLVGPVANEKLQPWFSAADLFCLASSKEGWANVLLESLACGTPVVATNVWGTPEVICSPALGILVDRTVESLASGLHDGLTRQWDRKELVDYASRFTWERVGDRVAKNYRLALDSR
jgi:glycosyltransferase involved in cell wall biosynthesis